MKFSMWPSPSQSFKTVQTLAHHIEQNNWDGMWLADHFMPQDNLDETRPECWTTLAALAASVPRIRLGSLVAGNTYRHPAVLAKMAATVDHISEGRAVLGLGSGWQENEHQKYGIEFYTVPERLRMLEEACQVIKSLYGESRSTFRGEYYQLDDAPLSPKPVQKNLPLLIGGGGEKVTLRIAATYADEWNVWATPELFKHKSAILDQHCEKIGRDPTEINRCIVALMFLSEDQGYLKKVREKGIQQPCIIGGVSEVRDIIASYQELGVQEIVVPDWTMGDDLNSRKLDTLNTFIHEVAPVVV